MANQLDSPCLLGLDDVVTAQRLMRVLGAFQGSKRICLKLPLGAFRILPEIFPSSPTARNVLPPTHRILQSYDDAFFGEYFALC